MIQRIKIFRMFAVRINFKSNEAYHKHQTQTTELGRRTDESSEVYSMPRMELVRSDLPFFIHFKSFFMRTNKDKSITHAKNPPTIRQILADEMNQSIRSLENKTYRELINFVMDEMSAKVRAYSFIIESGLNNDYTNFVKKEVLS